MSSNPFFSKEFKFKRALKALGITILCTIIILFLANYYINLIDTSLREHYVGNQTEEVIEVEEEVEETEEEIEYDNEQEPPKLEKGSVEEIKNELLTLIPEKYEIVEEDCYGAFTTQGICNDSYQIYPKDFTDIEIIYLNKAIIQYFNDVMNVYIAAQVGDVIYSEEHNRWIYRETDQEDVFLDIKEYGDTFVSHFTLGGSHAFYDYYIMDDSNEAIVLSIPSWNRIRCEYFEEGIETEDCESFLASMWEESDYPDYVPEGFYDEYYNDLLEILYDI